MQDRLVSTVHSLYLNTTEGRLFSDVNMRRALSASVDRDTIVNGLIQGYGEAAISMLTSAGPTWVTDCGYTFDPATAQSYKEAAVGADTPACTILLSSGMLGRWPYQDTAVMLQSQLKEIGIAAEIEIVDAATWSERLNAGDYDVTLSPFTVSAGEPNYFFVRNVQTGGSNNAARSYGISDPQIDALIEAVAVQPDRNQRIADYQELQRLVKDQEYIIPMWYDVTIYAMNNRVQNFNLDVTFCPDLFAVDVID